MLKLFKVPTPTIVAVLVVLSDTDRGWASTGVLVLESMLKVLEVH